MSKEAVPELLCRLNEVKKNFLQEATTEDVENILALKFEDIERELNDMTDMLPKMKSWEKSVVQLDNDIVNFEDPEMESSVQLERKLDHIKDDIVKLRSLIFPVDIRVTDKLRAMSFKPSYPPTEDDHDTVSQEFDLGIEGEIFKSQAMSGLVACFHHLESSQVKMCLLCLSIFPENIDIKKKTLIYWWMGEGIVTKTQDKTAEEVGELVLQELLSKDLIRPSRESKSPSLNSFIVCPWIRRMLILMAQEKKFLTLSSQWTPCNGKRRAFLWQGTESYIIMSKGEREEDLLTVFNVNKQCLQITTEWLTKLKKVEVLQMGRWQNSVTHCIKMENEKLLVDGLGSQKHLKYLSLQGISGIETLGDSVLKLISLQILDLRACHDLRELPSDISELKNLSHLDVSECYLLESMPKGLDQLCNLQVLKGFVINNTGAKSCKISHLAAQLMNLRKLSIRVCHLDEAQKEDQLGSLVNFSALRIVTILWGVVSSASATTLSLPESLTKLDLRCVPFNAVPEWLWPSRLPSLEKLYITGGKLNSLEHKDGHKYWNVKFLRLRYLKDLQIDQNELAEFFPEYLYLEKTSCDDPDSDIILKRSGS